jgi:hypothetical protein
MPKANTRFLCRRWGLVHCKVMCVRSFKWFMWFATWIFVNPASFSSYRWHTRSAPRGLLPQPINRNVDSCAHYEQYGPGWNFNRRCQIRGVGNKCVGSRPCHDTLGNEHSKGVTVPRRYTSDVLVKIPLTPLVPNRIPPRKSPQRGIIVPVPVAVEQVLLGQQLRGNVTFFGTNLRRDEKRLGRQLSSGIA